MKDNLIQQKSYEFALQLISLYQKLCKANEFVLLKLLLRSGTSIEASVEEAHAAQSKADFISTISIVSKESRESYYWLRLRNDSGMSEHTDLEMLLAEVSAIIQILTPIVKSDSVSNSKLRVKNSKLPSTTAFNSKSNIQHPTSSQ